MNIKNNQRYKMSSEKIETAFLALILNHKYEDISVSQICERAEINRSTFYAHYDGINDLVVTIESRFANSMASIFGFGNRLKNDAFLEMFEFVEKNKYFYKSFLNIPYTTIAEKNAKHQILTNIKNNVANTDPIEITYRATFFGAGIKEMCKLWLERDCKESPEQMAKLLKKEYSNRTANDIF